MCVKGTCCSKCVELKTHILRNNNFPNQNGFFYYNQHQNKNNNNLNAEYQV